MALSIVSARSVSPCIRALPTVSARSVSPWRCPPSVSGLRSSVPQSAVHRQCPLHSFVPECSLSSSVPQSAAHRQCPLHSFVPECSLRSSVPHECCPLSASGKGHLLIPRCVVRHGFLVFWTLFPCFWFWWWVRRHYQWSASLVPVVLTIHVPRFPCFRVCPCYFL